jgi:drug/metabolite transporter (DMT)-like permease
MDRMTTAPDVLYAAVLLAAVAHAVWNALLKSVDDRLLMMTAIRSVGLVYGLTMMWFVELPHGITWLWLVSAVAAHLVYFVLLIESYRLGDMSVVYPIARGSAPLLLALAAFVSIGETLSLGQVAAIALTSLGLFVLVFGRGSRRVAILAALATSVSIALYSLIGGIGVRAAGDVLSFQVWLELLLGLSVLSYLPIARDRAQIAHFVRRRAATGLAAGLISMAGFLAFLWAARYLPLAPVAALRETSLIFGAVIGTVAFREPFGRRRVAAATLVASGVVALAFLGRS